MQRELLLAVEGDDAGFPDLAEVAQRLKAFGATRVMPGRSLAPPSAKALRRALPPVKYPAVRNVFAPGQGGPRNGHGWISDVASERARALELGLASSKQARELGARWLVIELGGWGQAEVIEDPLGLRAAAAAGQQPAQDFQLRCEADADLLLDRLCRALHSVSQQVPEVGLALLTPGPGALPTPALLEAALEDLGPRRLAYWHDCGRARALAQRGVLREEEWLDRFAARCVGVDLTDSVAGLSGLPAGSGEVDFAAVRGALSRDTLAVLRAEPDPGPGPLHEALRVLHAAGF